MLIEIKQTNVAKLCQYLQNKENKAPYEYLSNEQDLITSLLYDIDGEGDRLFNVLETYTYEEAGNILGFIQYGASAFTLDETGKNKKASFGVIRNLYYEKGQNIVGKALVEQAMNFFQENNLTEKYAYFHYFGMTNQGRHGKLHESSFYIESLLADYHFKKNEENVYYSKDLTKQPTLQKTDITCVYHELTTGQQQEIELLQDGEKVGVCELHYLPQAELCYLRWIYVTQKLQHTGVGTKCMLQLFQELKQKGFKTLDTDTADQNLPAQHFYLKTGFSEMGRTRSYRWKESAR